MTTKTLRPLLALSLSALGCAAARPPAPATPRAKPAASAPAPAPALRSPDAILADAVQATGGAAAWSAHKTMRLKFTTELVGMAMSAPVEHQQRRDDRALTTTNFPGIGLMREGFNGKTLWKQDPINGLRTLSGAEAEQSRVEDAWNLELEARSLFAKIETAPDAPPGLECLTLTLKAGPPMRGCYDRRTHLQVSLEGTSTTPQGDAPFRTTAGDWRQVGGVRIPYTSRTQAGPVTFVNMVNEVTFDAPMDDKLFDPPAPGAP
ncbi:MAG TPA: hypothetical protein VHO06_19585 [Polyangia bacterium]|nr:hypothetical protein [Polyangia bacterium]